jgi:amino acid transporter
MTSQQLLTLVLIAAGAIAFLVICVCAFRWYLNRHMPSDSHARRRFTTFGKLHALAYVVCLVVGVLLVGAFPNGWLARLLEGAGPFIFGMVVITPALVFGLLLEVRGVRFYRDRSDDA